MSGWLSRAKEALSGRTAERMPEPIEFPCPCGRKIGATRRTAFQRVLCKACGECFFVLPLDVYPRPISKIVRKVKPPRTEASAERSTKNHTKAPADAAVATRPTVDIQAALHAAWQGARTQITPLRLIVACLVVVVAGTSWWQWTRVARDRANITFKAAWDAAEAALQRQEYVDAEQELGKAARAADHLRRTDVRAEQARQQHRELMAINALLQSSLPEVLEATQSAGGIDDAAHAFEVTQAGRWIVLQTEIVLPTTPGGSLPAWEERLQVGEKADQAIVLTGSLPVFAKVPKAQFAPNVSSDSVNAAAPAPPSVEDSGRREIIFAAQVDSLRWNAAASAWTLSLKSSTGFLWSDYDLLLVAGLGPDEVRTEVQLRQLLAEQSRWIGVAE